MHSAVSIILALANHLLKICNHFEHSELSQDCHGQCRTIHLISRLRKPLLTFSAIFLGISDI